MKSYEVQVHDAGGLLQTVWRGRATSPDRAVCCATPRVIGSGMAHCYRLRRIGQPRLERIALLRGPGGDDGPAGVREPRRPPPDSGDLRRAWEDPARRR